MLATDTLNAEVPTYVVISNVVQHGGFIVNVSGVNVPSWFIRKRPTPKMFALVRFLNEYDEEPYAVPVEDVKDFNPANENVFDRNKVYSTFWKDSEAPENTGLYPSQVLLLAGNCKLYLCGLFCSTQVYI